MIRLLLADDHAVLRSGMRRLLSDVPDLEVVVEVGGGFEAVDAVRSHQIDVALVDVTMPGPDVVTTIEQIRSASPHTRVIVVSTHPAEQYAMRVLRAGASAYVMKHEPWTEVVAAIRTVHEGGRYITAALAETLAESLERSTQAKPELSDREIQVLQKMAEGFSPAEIAVELNVSPSAVHTYRARLLQKLGLATDSDLIRYALKQYGIR